MSKNVVIIGSGPAGISAALYTCRAGFATTIISKGVGALALAEMENYYGFEDKILGADLHAAGMQQAQRLGAEMVIAEAVGLDFTDRLLVKTTVGDYPADAVILATGTQRTTPRIKGIKELEGRGVSYCATCDAFFYKNKAVAVLGDGEYALHEALELVHLASSVTILTNGKEPSVEIPSNISVDKRPLDSIVGTDSVQGVKFSDGEVLEIKGLFVAVGIASSNDLARKLGAETDGNKLVVDEQMQTAVPGLYAAGDCVGGLLQVAKAVYDGAVAGISVIKYLRSQG